MLLWDSCHTVRFEYSEGWGVTWFQAYTVMQFLPRLQCKFPCRCEGRQESHQSDHHGAWPFQTVPKSIASSVARTSTVSVTSSQWDSISKVELTQTTCLKRWPTPGKSCWANTQSSPASVKNAASASGRQSVTSKNPQIPSNSNRTSNQ